MPGPKKLNPELTEYKIAELHTSIAQLSKSMGRVEQHLAHQDLDMQKLIDRIGNSEEQTGLLGRISSNETRLGKIEERHTNHDRAVDLGAKAAGVLTVLGGILLWFLTGKPPGGVSA